MIQRFKQTLKESNQSFTKPRLIIFEHLIKSGPVTTARLAELCSPDIDRATVYRTVELFESLGIVNRIWHGFKSRIELSEIFTPHHHYAVCQHCGKSIEIISPELEKIITSLAKQNDFLALSHVIEISGYCKDCHK
ncbi:MAG: Fur family transcriptional regulator [Candidatus Woesebacteria bacterium]|jgi:Fe2+ or Zn2+ uptake regulation protein